MPHDILRDPRLKTLQWRDLVPLSRLEILHEITLSLPWLLASWILAARELYLPAMLCSFMFFLTGLRQAHGGQHYSLGLSRRATDLFLCLLSILMLGSMHAIQTTHMHHHRHCLDDDDIESTSARGSFLRALVLGPWFPVMLHYHALRLANRSKRTWIIAELLANILWITLVFALANPFLKYHILVMAIGQCFTAFFAVWTVHHDCDHDYFIARTSRGRLRNYLSYAMFLHTEHHLFPAVPTAHLSKLAMRLDQVAPELKSKTVF